MKLTRVSTLGGFKSGVSQRVGSKNGTVKVSTQSGQGDLVELKAAGSDASDSKKSAGYGSSLAKAGKIALVSALAAVPGVGGYFVLYPTAFNVGLNGEAKAAAILDKATLANYGSVLSLLYGAVTGSPVALGLTAAASAFSFGAEAYGLVKLGAFDS